MNRRLRAQAASQNFSLMEFLLRKIEVLRNEIGAATSSVVNLCRKLRIVTP